MNAPYDAAVELTKLATWIDQQLDNEGADRQYIAEQALARIQDIAQALTTARARALAAAPPVESEEQALGLPAVLAAEDAYAADPGPGKMVPLNRAILTEACEAAGVTLGGFDGFIIQYLARVNPTTCAVVAGWVTRAAAAAVLPAGQAGTEADSEAGQ